MGLYRDCPLYGLARRATPEQWRFLDAVHDKKVIFSNSGAGTGKTQCAVAMARYLIEAFPNRYTRARYIFSAVNEDEQGFLPGHQREKNAPYLKPLKDALHKIGCDPNRDIIITDEFDEPINNGWIYAHSHTYERGSNYEHEIVIVEEAQNYTARQLKKILTRGHDSSKMIIIGHTGQIDLPDPSHSGFYGYVEHFRSQPYAAHAPMVHDFRGEISQHADRYLLDHTALINAPY